MHTSAPVFRGGIGREFFPPSLLRNNSPQGTVSVYNTEGHRALYLLHYRKKGALNKIAFRHKRSPTFFFAGDGGVVYGADEHGSCIERYKVGSPIVLLEFCVAHNRVVLITQGTMLATFTLDVDGRVKNETKLKLSCGPRPETLRGVTMTTPGSATFMLATVSEESIIRVWNVIDEESYLLSLVDVDDALMGDKAVSIDFEPRKRMLAVGTKNGKLIKWRCATNNFHEHDWHHLAVRNLDPAGVSCLQWGVRSGESILYALEQNGSCMILSETQLSHSLKPPFLGVQVAPSVLLLHKITEETIISNPSSPEDDNPSAVVSSHRKNGKLVEDDQIVECPFRIRGVAVSPPYIAVWSAKVVHVFNDCSLQGKQPKEPKSKTVSGTPGSLELENSFERHTNIASCCLFVTKEEATILVACGSKVEVCNLSGSARKSLTFSAEAEGMPGRRGREKNKWGCF